MPVFAQYDFNDTDTTVHDTALGNGAQNGLYLNGATHAGGQLVLDGVNDIAKIYPSTAFQLDRGTLDIQFTQTSHTGTGANTIVSRDSVGDTPGGYHIDVLADGSIQVVHETGSGAESFGTPAGFAAPGDEIHLSYSWDSNGTGGQLVVENLTCGNQLRCAGAQHCNDGHGWRRRGCWSALGHRCRSGYVRPAGPEQH